MGGVRLSSNLEDHLQLLQQGEQGPLRVFELVLFGTVQFFQREGMADTAHKIEMMAGSHIGAHHACTGRTTDHGGAGCDHISRWDERGNEATENIPR